MPKRYHQEHLQLLHRIETETLHKKVKASIQYILDEREKAAQENIEIFLGALYSICKQQQKHPMCSIYHAKIEYRKEGWDQYDKISEETCTWGELHKLVDKGQRMLDYITIGDHIEAEEQREQYQPYLERYKESHKECIQTIQRYIQLEVNKKSGKAFRDMELYEIGAEHTRTEQGDVFEENNKSFQFILEDEEWAMAGIIEKKLCNIHQKVWHQREIENAWNTICSKNFTPKFQENLVLRGGYGNTIGQIAPPMRSTRVGSGRQQELDFELGYTETDFSPHFNYWGMRIHNAGHAGAPPVRDLTDPPLPYYHPHRQYGTLSTKVEAHSKYVTEMTWQGWQWEAGDWTEEDFRNVANDLPLEYRNIYKQIERKRKYEED